MKKKILHLFGGLNRGGAEMRTLDVLRYLSEQELDQDIELHFLSLSGNKGVLDDQFKQLGAQIHYLKIHQLDFPIKFVQLLRKNKFDVVHSHVHYASGYIMMLAWIAQIGVRITHFRSSSDGKEATPLRKIYRSSMKAFISLFSNRILAVSETSLAISWRDDWKKDLRCKPIYNGLPADLFGRYDKKKNEVRDELGIRPDNFLIIHVGRISAVKNHERLIDIFYNFQKNCRDTSLLLVGDGDENLKAKIQKKVVDYGIVDKVKFAGLRNDVPKLLNAADCMVFPSLYEGLPGAVLEACATGIPVVATDIPVIKEISAYLPVLTYVSLSQSDDEWCLAIHESISNATKIGPEQVRESFRNSPFTVSNAAHQLMGVWQS